MSDIFEGATGDVGRAMRPSSDYGRTQRFAEVPLSRAAAAEGLEVQTYRAAKPVANDRRVQHGQQGDQTHYGASVEGDTGGKSKMPEFRGGAQDHTALGVDEAELFGVNAEVAGGMAGGAPGVRPVRNMSWESR